MTISFPGECEQPSLPTRLDEKKRLLFVTADDWVTDYDSKWIHSSFISYNDHSFNRYWY